LINALVLINGPGSRGSASTTVMILAFGLNGSFPARTVGMTLIICSVSSKLTRMARPDGSR
jgi:hypothetical protein